MGAHTRHPFLFRSLGNRAIWIKLPSRQWYKSYWILSVMFPCARNVLIPTQHVIHSDFGFFLSYFVMFVLFPLVLFYVFVCLWLNLFLLCIHSSIVVSPARPVGKYSSFWFDSILHALFIHTTAFDCLTISYHYCFWLTQVLHHIVYS